MTGYALADRRSQWYGNTFSSASFKPNCGVIHTTEGFGWPGYSGGAMAPNYTAKPDFANKRLLFRQHFEDEESSRALENRAGGVQTNTANCIQIELIGTCDSRNATTWSGKKVNVDYIYWPEAPDWALRDFAKFIADMNKRHGIKIQGPPTGWSKFPWGEGVRFTFAQWQAFYGWCGHQHVPENGHGDPGNFPWATVAKYANAIVAGTTPTPPTKPEVPPVAYDPSKRAPAVSNPNTLQIWDADVIAAPNADDPAITNKWWTPSTVLMYLIRDSGATRKDLAAMKKDIAEIKKNTTPAAPAPTEPPTGQ